MYKILKNLLNKFFKPKPRSKNQWLPGDRYYYDNQWFTILTVPDKNYKYYDISVLSLTNVRLAYSACITTFIPRNTINSKYYLKFKSTKRFIEYLQNAMIHDINKNLYNKVIHQYETAAIHIQYAWRRYKNQITIKRKNAVILIEKNALHMLYRPGGRLAPTCFS